MSPLLSRELVKLFWREGEGQKNLMHGGAIPSCKCLRPYFFEWPGIKFHARIDAPIPVIPRTPSGLPPQWTEKTREQCVKTCIER